MESFQPGASEEFVLMFPTTPSLGPTEIVVLLFALAFWIGVGAFVASAARALLHKTDQAREIARLSEENRRLRDALADRSGGRP